MSWGLRAITSSSRVRGPVPHGGGEGGRLGEGQIAEGANPREVDAGEVHLGDPPEGEVHLLEGADLLKRGAGGGGQENEADRNEAEEGHGGVCSWDPVRVLVTSLGARLRATFQMPMR